MDAQSIYPDKNSLNADVSLCATLTDDTISQITNPKLLREKIIDSLAYTAALSGDTKLRAHAQNTIRGLGKCSGVASSSIHPVYTAIGRGEVKGFTVPAMNVRTLTYDFAMRAFRLALAHKIGAMIFEIAASEQKYTDQEPSEYSAIIIAAALKEGYKGPIFLQGDHYQAKADMFRDNRDGEIQRLKELINRSIEAEFYNIDIDGSTLVELDKPATEEQQRNNYEITALLTEHIRSIQPQSTTISIGGEIGHIGGVNSTIADFRAFMDGYTNLIQPKHLVGLSKVSVQNGTSHGGKPLPDGHIAKVDLDFKVLKDIGAVARSEYHIGGAVQHAASTLPENLFHQFPAYNTLEIHLATGFQNIIFAHLDHALKDTIYAWIRKHVREEFEESMTDEQFIYKGRKKAWGAFKKDMWLLPAKQKAPILDALEQKLALLFKALGIINTQDIIAQYY